MLTFCVKKNAAIKGIITDGEEYLKSYNAVYS